MLILFVRSAIVVADGGVYKGGKATDCKEGDRAGGAAAFKRWVAGVLWWEEGALYREASKEVSDMVDLRVPGCKAYDWEPL